MKHISTSEERHRMIAADAYGRAERRGFKGGDPVRDWLDAEVAIDESIKHPGETELQKPELAAYEKMGPRWEAILVKRSELFEGWRDRGGNYLNQVTKALNDWVSRYRNGN